MPTILRINQQTDPTRTLTLRARYASAIGRRFNGLQADVRASIADNDVFELVSPSLAGFTPAPPGAFAFPANDARLNAFMEWFHDRIDHDILEIMEREGRTITRRRRWQDRFIRAGYLKGVTDATTRLRQAGIDVEGERTIFDDILNAPIHRDGLRFLLDRNFEELNARVPVP